MVNEVRCIGRKNRVSYFPGKGVHIVYVLYTNTQFSNNQINSS